MKMDSSYVRGVAAKARELCDEAPDRAARDMLTAIAKIFEAEADAIQKQERVLRLH